MYEKRDCRFLFSPCIHFTEETKVSVLGGEEILWASLSFSVTGK